MCVAKGAWLRSALFAVVLQHAERNECLERQVSTRSKRIPTNVPQLFVFSVAITAPSVSPNLGPNSSFPSGYGLEDSESFSGGYTWRTFLNG